MNQIVKIVKGEFLASSKYCLRPSKAKEREREGERMKERDRERMKERDRERGLVIGVGPRGSCRHQALSGLAALNKTGLLTQNIRGQ